MSLDARTLLFSLILTNALMVLSLFVASAGGRRDGIGKWATAILLETFAWMLVAARGSISDVLSIVIANGLLAGTFAMMLAAICEFQKHSPSRWQYLAPVVLSLLMASILIDDIRGRFIWGGIIYILQIALIAKALLSHNETRSGRAWRLLFGGTVLIMLELALRSIVALSGQAILSMPQTGGTLNWIQIVSFVVVMATSLLGSIGFLLIVKERADREVMHLAMTDSLTGVPNRRAMMDYAEKALALRRDGHLALLMIDVDHFKHINDIHGHPAGDDVLCQVAKLLAGRLRGGDLLGRYGGEEFCVVAPDTDAEGALQLANSLREIVASTALNTERGTLSVTVSIGVSHSPFNTERKLKAILAEADAALYAAKKNGRNQVVCFR